MSSTKVSIFIAAYNQAPFLSQAIESAVYQDCAVSFEVIVINDGSTDGTPAVMQRYQSNPRLRIYHQANQGLSRTCNRGLAEAQGEFFVRLDADDYLERTAISDLLTGIDQTEPAVAVYSDRYVEYADGTRTTSRATPDNLFDMIACGVLMHTDELREVGGYRDVFWEEYDLFLRLKAKGAFVHIPRPLYHYRRHSANMTNDTVRRVEGWRELIMLHGAKTVRKAGDVNAIMELRELLDAGSV